MTVRAFSGVVTDRVEYSRYLRSSEVGDLGVVVVTAKGIDGDPGDPLVFTLVNTDNGRVVARKVIEYDPMIDDEETVAFDLEKDCLDEWKIFRAIRGRYVARVSDLPDPAYADPGVAAESAAWRIRIVSVQELRERWLFGVALRDERRLVADQTRIAGVRVTDSEGIQEGGYPLRYIAATGLLMIGSDYGGIPSFGDGVDVRAGGEFTLWMDSSDAYAVVRVDAAALPTSGTADGKALLRAARMTDATLGTHLDNATEAWQGVIGLTVPLEPWTIGTDIAVAVRQAKEAADPALARLPFDRTGVSPSPYDNPKIVTEGPFIDLPGRRVLRLHEIVGYYNTSPVLLLDTPDWWVVHPYNGTATIVPSFSARLPAAPVLAGFAAIGGYPYAGFVPRKVENFWHYSFTHGLADLHRGAGEMIREAIARTAIQPIMLSAGRGMQSAFASESFNRDGVSLSRNYTGGQLGLYSGEITAHSQWVKDNRFRIRRLIVGIVSVG